MTTTWADPESKPLEDVRKAWEQADRTHDRFQVGLPGEVAVLGCGPAGLLAAHAVSLEGLQPRIFSMYRRSPIGGAQYLHAPIPELTGDEPDGYVTFVKDGTRDGYAKKVYGRPDAEVSWDLFEAGDHQVWNMRLAYDLLWQRYERHITDAQVHPRHLDGLARLFPLTLSCIPAKTLCMLPGRHRFTDQLVYISTGDEQAPPRDMTIVYNGELDIPWYRGSRIFNTPGVEWPEAPEGLAAHRIHKPLWTNCDCHPDLVRLGRYGAWQKSLLIHDAFFGAQRAVQRLREQST